MTTMHRVVIVAAAVGLLASPAFAQSKDNKSDKPDPLVKTYTLDSAAMFGVMGRAISAKWNVTQTDKDLCLVTFEEPQRLTSSGYDATATCEAVEGGTRIRLRVRQKGDLSLKGKETGFARKVFAEIDKAVAERQKT